MKCSSGGMGGDFLGGGYSINIHSFELPSRIIFVYFSLYHVWYYFTSIKSASNFFWSDRKLTVPIQNCSAIIRILLFSEKLDHFWNSMCQF